MLQTLTVIVSTILQTKTVWMLSETVNGLMAIPNLVALVVLSHELFRITGEYKQILAETSANGGTYENFN